MTRRGTQGIDLQALMHVDRRKLARRARLHLVLKLAVITAALTFGFVGAICAFLR